MECLSYVYFAEHLIRDTNFERQTEKVEEEKMNFQE